ncbi:head-tail connector protein [Aurantimonas sp. 22II-16-19i]|uniref:head-tail connector protein n=1 Tax=Aurantimonas sp. 22II-16-19i TaxID=1317114 RepID=UPI0009F7DA6D|nr:head-tail connector protein [Aurantimonas sp. 22II-16-19i]ORE90152.1 hypothetical protein ATO4_22057 [Aurantimonas sp. 22II-16-19i]
MSVTVSDLKSHLNLDTVEDDALLSRKIAAAKAWIASYTGTPFPETDTPADLDEAVLQLATHFYEHRGDEAEADIPATVRSLCAGSYVFAF